MERPENTRHKESKYIEEGFSSFKRHSPPPSYTQEPSKEEWVMSLSGNQIPISEFSHNNQVPFYGSQVRQSTVSDANSPLLEVFTGTPIHDISKREISPMFSPSKNMSHLKGTPSYNSNLLDRYQPARTRQNERPVGMEPVNVGPGIDQGYVAKPHGGFNQSGIRKHVMPKSVDDLRTANNPKVSYEGRVISGSGISRRGIHGTVEKQLPDRYFVNTPDRYFRGPGAVKGRKQRPKIVDRRTNRQFQTREYSGTAGPSAYKKPTQREKASGIPHKQQYRSTPNRNFSAMQKWTPTGDDNGRGGVDIPENERVTTQLNNYLSNAVTAVKNLIAPIADVFRVTRKENTIGNIRQAGNIQNPTIKLPVQNPNDTARTTLKETLINDSRTGVVNGGFRQGRAVDPNDITRTTIKQTNIHDTREGFVNSGYAQGKTRDPNDTTRVTLKQTNINNNRTGNVGQYGGRKALTVHDSNDTTRVTLKQTNINNNRTGNVGQYGGRKALTVHDPNNILKTTVKETNIDNNRTGGMQSGVVRGTVQDPTPTRTTVKETNINDTRTGNVGQYEGRRAITVHDPNDILKRTVKETNLHDERTGNVSTQPSGLGDGSKAGVSQAPSDVAKTTHRQTMPTQDQTRNMSGSERQTVYDPNDVAKTTIKEQNIHDNRDGNIEGKDQGLGYITNEKEAPPTNRQYTSNNEHVGDADGPETGGYQVNDCRVPETQRQYTADYEYEGTANSLSKAPMSYQDIYNATMNEIKEQIAQGRDPTQSSTKIGAGSSSINMEIKPRTSNDEGERESVQTRIVGLGPSMDSLQITRDKNVLDNRDLSSRHNPELLQAFKENPFTKSLTDTI
jgi:hypothetical protein